MALRSALQTLLESLTPTVYYQDPSDVDMEFPCIVYTLNSAKTIFADNSPFINVFRYQVTVIDADPDSPIPGQVGLLPMCLFNTRFVVANRYHTVYNLYY